MITTVRNQTYRSFQKLTVFFISVLLLTVAVLPCVSAVSIDAIITDTASYLSGEVSAPTVASIGGEWTVFGLARSGASVPKGYFDTYYQNLVSTLGEKQGVLHSVKYTEYARAVLAVTAIGRDARNVAGYDLTLPLADYSRVTTQGVNSVTYALLALDSAEYPMPENSSAKIQATRQDYIAFLLSKELTAGGWNLTGKGTADADVTAMVLQALSKYRAQKKVSEAIERGLTCLSSIQKDSGGFESWGVENAESSAQVLCALSELGISYDDARFTKNGKTVMDALLSYYRKGKGFSHTADGGTTLMTTEQALYALVSVKRLQNGETSLYRMSGTGLSGKHPEVQVGDVVRDGNIFPDVTQKTLYHEAIVTLTSRGIINGKGNGRYEPKVDMTRAEFATILVRSLGLTPKTNGAFSDVSDGDWFASYVGAANEYGLIQGTGGGKFSPNGTVSRQEAAVMVTRAAALCGIDTTVTQAEIDTYTKGLTVADWAKSAVAFCRKNALLTDSLWSVSSQPILRGEMAELLYRLFLSSQLI